MAILQTQVIDILKSTFIPGEKKQLLTVASLEGVEINGKDIQIFLSTFISEQKTLNSIKETLEQRLMNLGAEKVQVEIRIKTSPNIKYLIAIASGKGGVGKSTVTTNLAVALAKLGKKVGILDADLYGPNIPLMFGINEIPDISQDRKIIPFNKFGVKLISLGFLLENPSTPIIWRGPLITKAIEQLYFDVEWNNLEFLLLDLPPGTGDISITIAQSLPTKYGIIVTTPQDVSVSDATKALIMFNEMNIKVLGVIENMSYFICPNCNTKHEIFGSGGGEKLSNKFSVPLLGKIPIELKTREGGDIGIPILEVNDNLYSKNIYLTIAERLVSMFE